MGKTAVSKRKQPEGRKKSFWERLKYDMRRNWPLCVMFLPVLIYYIIFSYTPMYGILLAFKDYKVKKGIIEVFWAALGWALSILNVSFPGIISGD